MKYNAIFIFLYILVGIVTNLVHTKVICKCNEINWL